LKRLPGSGLSGLHQLFDGLDAVVGSLQRLNGVSDAVEQAADVAGAVGQRGSREKVDRVIKRRIDLFAARKALLRLRHQARRVLQGQEIRPHTRRKNDIATHSSLHS
jgi:hypothetical protein